MTLDAPRGPCIATRVRVGWRDCDPAGIAFYPRLFEWMDLVSHLLAREMGITRDDLLPPSSLGFPLVKAEAEFLAPANLDDEVEIRTRVNRIGRTSLVLRHEVVRLAEPEVLLARGSESRVHVRRTEGGLQPRALTPAMRAVLERYLER